MKINGFYPLEVRPVKKRKVIAINALNHETHPKVLAHAICVTFK